MSRREAILWLVWQLAAVAAGIAFGMWLFNAVSS